MAQRIEAKEVTVAAGTLATAPAVTALPFADGVVTRLEIRVPPGPSGLVGFQVRHSGQRVIPYRDNTWIVTDDERLDWTLSEYPTGGAWQVAAYNTDVYDHTLYLRFHVDEIGAGVPAAPAIVPIIEAAPAQSPSVENPDVPDVVIPDIPTIDDSEVVTA